MSIAQSIINVNHMPKQRHKKARELCAGWETLKTKSGERHTYLFGDGSKLMLDGYYHQVFDCKT